MTQVKLRQMNRNVTLRAHDAADIVYSSFKHAHTHNYQSLINHIPSQVCEFVLQLPHSGRVLRHSDWPRLLKMDLKHLPFIAFPLPLPDVTAEHDFPRKKVSLLFYYRQEQKTDSAAAASFEARTNFSFFIITPTLFVFFSLLRCKMFFRRRQL